MCWLFTRGASLDSTISVIWWWELRRAPYNVIVAVTGAICLSVYAFSIIYVMEPDPPDLVEPLALLAAPFAVNLAYTLGWIAELALRQFGVHDSGPVLMRLGLAATLFFIALPAAVWGMIALATSIVRLL